MIKHSGHLRALEKCAPAARVFYISLVFWNARRVLSQCNTRLGLLYLLIIIWLAPCAGKMNQILRWLATRKGKIFPRSGLPAVSVKMARYWAAISHYAITTEKPWVQSGKPIDGKLEGKKELWFQIQLHRKRKKKHVDLRLWIRKYLQDSQTDQRKP